MKVLRSRTINAVRAPQIEGVITGVQSARSRYNSTCPFSGVLGLSNRVAFGRRAFRLPGRLRMKVCTACNVSQPLANFNKMKRRSDGLDPRCRTCEQERCRAWRGNHPGYDSARAKKRPSIMAASKAQRRAKAAGTGGSFTFRQWEALLAKFDYCCAACGERRKLQVDHIVPLCKGGTSYISNIQPLCGPCNRRKRHSIVDFRLAVRA